MSFQINNTQFNIDLKKLFKINNFCVKSYRNSYEVLFDNNIIEHFFTDIYDHGDYIIIDSNIYELYFKNIFSNTINYSLIIANEDNKNIYSSLNIITKMLDLGFNKKNKLIVIGGGITQDISSFVAGTLKRGINWIFIPTTLLAMTDSCIGSKTALNHNNSKNQLGLFYPPNKVYINKLFLSTLSKKEINSGLGEIIKLFLIGGLHFIKKLNIENITNDYLIELVYNALIIKKTVIEYDEFDKNERNALNYGHTIGHVIEKISNYDIPHGIAVFIGIKIINSLFNFKCEIVDNITGFIIGDYKLENYDKKYFKKLLLTDKKVKGNEITFIVIENYGKVKFIKEKIDDALIDKILKLI